MQSIGTAAGIAAALEDPELIPFLQKLREEAMRRPAACSSEKSLKRSPSISRETT
jgi:hypothetical protein